MMFTYLYALKRDTKRDIKSQIGGGFNLHLQFF